MEEMEVRPRESPQQRPGEAVVHVPLLEWLGFVSFS